jgi:AcrR family transcriptional regulator
MSIDSVAEVAGVTKPTIYLRYPNKAALAGAALELLKVVEMPSEIAQIREDLIVQMNLLRTEMAQSVTSVLFGGLLAEEHENPKLFAQFQQSVVNPRRQALRSILVHALEADEMSAQVDVDIAVTLLVSAHYAQYLSGTPFAPGWSEAVVDHLLHGLLTGPKNGRL